MGKGCFGGPAKWRLGPYVILLYKLVNHLYNLKRKPFCQRLLFLKILK